MRYEDGHEIHPRSWILQENTTATTEMKKSLRVERQAGRPESIAGFAAVDTDEIAFLGTPVQ